MIYTGWDFFFSGFSSSSNWLFSINMSWASIEVWLLVKTLFSLLFLCNYCLVRDLNKTTVIGQFFGASHEMFAHFSTWWTCRYLKVSKKDSFSSPGYISLIIQHFLAGKDFKIFKQFVLDAFHILNSPL